MDTKSERAVTLGETAEMLYLSKRTTKNLIDSGVLPAVRIGPRGQYRLDVTVVREFLRGGGGTGVEKEATR